jgi:hypothetical protein
MSKITIGIDPGNTHTAIVILENCKIISHFYEPNETALQIISSWRDTPSDIFCEMIASYGMPVGKTVFETCLFIGRIMQAVPKTKLITRNSVKNTICHSSKAKDANIRQALIDIYGIQGTKKNNGGTYGLSGDKWAALAVATAALHGAKLYELES